MACYQEPGYQTQVRSGDLHLLYIPAQMCVEGIDSCKTPCRALTLFVCLLLNCIDTASPGTRMRVLHTLRTQLDL